MKTLKVLAVLFIVVLVQFLPAYVCLASPSGGLHREGDDVFDDWQVCRTRLDGADGYLQLEFTEIAEGYWVELGDPLIALESLGQWTDIAYGWGEEFADYYPDRNQRAEAIFYFVRDKVRYRVDSDQFGLDEFARNADETANTIMNEGVAYGDCEDMAILLAVMYQGAGYRSAIAAMWDGEGSGHVAPFVYLPGYQKAENWTIDGERGWIWAEATGSTNPFGWYSEDYYLQCSGEGGGMLVRELVPRHIARVGRPGDGELPVTAGGPSLLPWIVLFFGVMGLMGGVIVIGFFLVRRGRA